MKLPKIKTGPHLEFSLLIRAHRRRKDIRFRALYQWLLRRYKRSNSPIHARLYGFPLLLNPGNQYPLMIEDYPLFNTPLVELTYQVYLSRGGPLRFVDIGAATGDTVLLIKNKCPGQVEEFVCVDGDAEFFKLLAHNMAQFDDVHIVQTVLSRESMQIGSLVKHHLGTAAAVGNTLISAEALDDVEEVTRSRIDVLKIDVDGFDGAVLNGAKQILRTKQPAVIFEWHPKLLKVANNDPSEAFLTLTECGYHRYLWFKNDGGFSHFSNTITLDVLRKTTEYLLEVNHRADEHFDVIALSDSSKIDELALAATVYARSH